MTVAVLIPSIPPRREYLAAALSSVAMQTRPVDQISVCMDHQRQGAPRTLARCFEATDTEWVICLGDDDWLAPECVEKLLAASEGADVVYPGYTVVGGEDPRPWLFGVPFQPEFVNGIAGGGALIRSAAIKRAGGIPTPEITPQSEVSGEDFLLWNRMLETGATFRHLPERLYWWRHHNGNTSGLPQRWQSEMHAISLENGSHWSSAP